MRPALSVREDAASTMAGAIFMSNTVTREQGFQAGVFGLPLEYESFVYNIRKRMPLFLFDYNLRKLYGVFEAASDGGLNINRDAFQHAYPAQVRVNIIWKCRPLSEDEFSPAIEENYYLPRKFYFDLSYNQVVRLYELFNDRRVGRPVHSYPNSESLETKDFSKGTPEKRSLTPIFPHSNDQSHLLIPDISAVVRRYSTHISKHKLVPPSVVTPENFGDQIAPMHSHHDRAKYPSQSELFQAASRTDGVSTQASALYSQSTTHHQMVGIQSYPLHHDYPHKILSSGRTIEDTTEGAKFVANQSDPSSHGYIHSSSLSSGYVSQNPTYGERKHVGSTSTPYAPSYPHIPPANPQGIADYQEHCEICIKQRHEMYAYERQRFSEGKASQQGIPACPEVPKCQGNTLSAVDQKRSGSSDYISLPDCGEDSEKASDSSDLENDIGVDISNPRHPKHAIGDETNTKVPQSRVFCRLSLSRQPPSQEAGGPTLSQLVSSLSQKAKQWSDQNGQVVDGVCYMIREQATDRSYSHSELNLPSQVEFEAEEVESIEPQPPFLNFKRHSEALKMDTSLAKENVGKVKRRKLVRPSFRENNASTCSGKEAKGNWVQERKDDHVEVGRNHFDIDLNIPAPEDFPLEKDNSIEVCPSDLTKIQTEKLCELDANKTNCYNVMEAIKEQVPSSHNGAPAKKVSFDYSIAELNTMNESKLRIILDQTSSLLQALGKLASAKSNNTEEARSSVRREL